MITSLIALVPICTLAFTFIYDKIEVKASDLQFALIACHDRSVELFASNQGNRAAIFKHAEVIINAGEPQALIANMDTQDRLIEGGATRSITLVTNEGVNPVLVPHGARQADNCQLTIRLQSISFDHKQDNKEVSCACP